MSLSKYVRDFFLGTPPLTLSAEETANLLLRAHEKVKETHPDVSGSVYASREGNLHLVVGDDLGGIYTGTPKPGGRFSEIHVNGIDGEIAKTFPIGTQGQQDRFVNKAGNYIADILTVENAVRNLPKPQPKAMGG